MTSFDFEYNKNHQPQPFLFSNCLSPFEQSKEQSVQAYFGSSSNAVNMRNTSNMAEGESDTSNTFLQDALKLLKPNRQPQQEQLQQTQEKTKELDDLLAKSMASLSFQERQQHQEVLHGVASAVLEDEEQIEMWLQAMDQHLQERIAKSHGDAKTSAYEYAHRTNPTYVQNRKLRLMFLRSNQYNPESAASKMFPFFTTKEGLFGRDKLCKDITLEDMDEDDKKAILGGVFQILGKDQAGRQIMFEFTSLRTECPTLQSELRARYYLFLNVLMNNPAAQINGIVLVIYGVEKFQDQSGGNGFVQNTSMVLSLPLHFAGVHLCISDLKQYVICTGAVKLFPAGHRARFKVHFGSHLECQYLLSTYGIAIENLPLISNTNEARMDYHWQWYRECFVKECGGQSSNNVATGHPDLPEFLLNLPYIRTNDVLFHRRKCNNGGNQRLRALARHLLQGYNKGNKHVKRKLVDYMIADIANMGGRFLKEGKQPGDGIAWELVQEPEIREKISQMFRNHRRPNVHQQQDIQQQEHEVQQQQEPDFLTGNTSQSLSERTAATAASNETERPPSPPAFPSPPATPSPSVVSHHSFLLHDDHNDADVLFGRRRNNAGNKLVRKMVSELAPEYETANRARKLEIANAIVERVQAFGGRFLRKTDDERWEEVGNDFARAKISKHFRNHRRPQKPKQPASSMAILGASRNSTTGIIGLPI